nr:cytosol aminopeptidase isoform X2 [Nothobranchius furzeri]
MLVVRKAVQSAVRKNINRSFSASRPHLKERNGLVLGVFEKEGDEGALHLTESAARFDQSVCGKLSELLHIAGPGLKKGKNRIFYGIHQDFPCVAVVGLGKSDSGVCGAENWDAGKENIRHAVSVGCRSLQELEVSHVEVDGCGDPQSAAEGAVLGLFNYDQLKSKKKIKVTTQLHGSSDVDCWKKGVVYGEGQNLARFLMEAPANHITPTAFASTIEEKLAPHAERVTISKRKSKMSSSMSGMFPGQQPTGPHSVGGPGGPGQPGFPSTAPRPQGNNTLVDELEASFEACFSSLVSQDYVNGTDQEEIRTGVDQCIQKFLDVARQTECFFLQKRLQLSVQKPEQVVKEDVSELRNELLRKELLVQKHLTKLHNWQQVLEDLSGQHRKPTDLPPHGPLAFLEQASASLPPAPLKPS